MQFWCRICWKDQMKSLNWRSNKNAFFLQKKVYAMNFNFFHCAGSFDIGNTLNVTIITGESSLITTTNSWWDKWEKNEENFDFFRSMHRFFGAKISPTYHRCSKLLFAGWIFSCQWWRWSHWQDKFHQKSFWSGGFNARLALPKSHLFRFSARRVIY